MQRLNKVFARLNLPSAVLKMVCAVLLPLILMASADASVKCKDEFKYTLGAQVEHDGLWASFTDQSALPINHSGGDGFLTFAVTRVDAQWLQINAALVFKPHFWTWKVQVEMDEQSPKSFTKTFRPGEDMPLFAISLVPVCTGI